MESDEVLMTLLLIRKFMYGYTFMKIQLAIILIAKVVKFILKVAYLKLDESEIPLILKTTLFTRKLYALIPLIQSQTD